MQQMIQRFVLASNRWDFTNNMYKVAVQMLLKCLVRGLHLSRNLRSHIYSIYTINSFSTGDWRAGLSDVDLLLVYQTSNPEDGCEFLSLFCNVLNKWVPFRLLFQHIILLDIGELRNDSCLVLHLTDGDPHNTGPWALIYGKDIRDEIRLSQAPGADSSPNSPCIYGNMDNSYLNTLRHFYSLRPGQQEVRSIYTYSKKILRAMELSSPKRVLPGSARGLGRWRDSLKAGGFRLQSEGDKKRADSELLNLIRAMDLFFARGHGKTIGGFKRLKCGGIEGPLQAGQDTARTLKMQHISRKLSGEKSVAGICFLPRIYSEDEIQMMLFIDPAIDDAGFAGLLAAVRAAFPALVSSGIFPVILTMNMLMLYSPVFAPEAFMWSWVQRRLFSGKSGLFCAKSPGKRILQRISMIKNFQLSWIFYGDDLLEPRGRSIKRLFFEIAGYSIYAQDGEIVLDVPMIRERISENARYRGIKQAMRRIETGTWKGQRKDTYKALHSIISGTVTSGRLQET
ncbi:MAG: hypothetical protein ABH879_04770 [archaeon]